MDKKLVWLGGALALAAVLAGRPAPAQAFWLGVPSYVQSWRQQATAQEGGTMMSPPSSGGMAAPSSGGTGTMPPPGGASGQMPGGDNQFRGVPPSGGETMRPGGEFMGQPQGEGGMMRKEQTSREIQRGGFEMDRNLRQFEGMMQEGERHGQPPSDETRARMDRSRTTVNEMKNGRMGEEGAGGEGMNRLDEDMQMMEQERREKQMQEQQLKMLQRGLRGMEQGVTMFERQLNSLAKRGLPVPGDIKEKIDKAKTTIAAVKAAKTFEEAEAAGLQDMQEVMQDLNESRMQLEMLARWPQMLKEADRQMAQLQRELKRAKTIVARLLKKEIDISSTYSAFEAAVGKLQTVRDEAVAKVKAGEAEEAMESIQSDFFGQMEDAWQSQKVIMMMSNLGRFMSDFKRGLADAQRMIRQAERRKADASELKELYAQAKAKGDAIAAMLKGGEIDEEEIMSSMNELEDIKQQFEEKFQELMGINETQSWEKGPSQFKEIQVAPDVARLFMKNGGGEQ